MKKFNSTLILLTLGVMLACQPNQIDEILTPESLNKDPLFISIMQQNETIKSKFNNSLSRVSDNTEVSISTLRSSIELTKNYEELVVILGYSSVNEFEDFNRKLFSTYQEFFKKYPILNIDNSLSPIYKDAVSLYFTSEITEHETSDSNERIAGGCAGGVGCIRSAVDCDRDAEVDFAVASASCTGLGWFAVGWALCQGSANLVLAADKIGCAYQLEKCCDL